MAEIYNTILLKGSKSRRQEEAVAAAGITPGHLCDYVSPVANMMPKVQKHATSGGATRKLFALEDSFQGRSIDFAYVANEPVFLHEGQPGDWINALVPAGAASIAAGDQLMSNGDGTLVKTTGAGAVSLAEAQAALDNSGGGSVARLVVMLL